MKLSVFRSFAGSFLVALLLVLWLTWNLGKVWKTGGALGVLGCYLMMVLGIMAALQGWAWLDDRHRRRHPPPDTGPGDSPPAAGPAMSSHEPLRRPDRFELSSPSPPIEHKLGLTRRYRCAPDRPRRRI